MKDFIKNLLKAGWTEKKVAHRWAKHLKYLCPCWKHRLIVSRTPSDWNAYKLNIGLIKKFGCTDMKFFK